MAEQQLIKEPNDGWPTGDASIVGTKQAATAETGDLSVEDDLKLGPPIESSTDRIKEPNDGWPTGDQEEGDAISQVAPPPSPAVQQTAAVLSKKEPPTTEPEQQRRTSRSPIPFAPGPATAGSSRQVEAIRKQGTLEEGLEETGDWLGEVVDVAGDISQGAISGAAKAVRNQVRDIDRAARWLEENVAGFGGIWIDDKGVHILSSKELRDKGGPAELKNIIPEADDPEGMAGFITQGIAQFITGFVTGGRIVKGIGGATKTGRAAELMFRSAIADATVWDDHDERLANLVQSLDVLGPVETKWGYKINIHKEFVDYLAADPNDSIAEDKFKSVTEGIVIGGLLSPFLRSTQAFKKARAAKEAARIEKLRATPRAGSARIATALRAAEASDLADEVAAKNQDIAQQLIKEFQVEQRRPGWKPGDEDVTISKLNEDTGLLEIDYEAVRKLGRQRSEELFRAQREAEIAEQFKGQPEQIKAAMEQTEEAMAAGRWDKDIDKWTSPVLNPEKFNHIISIASDLKNSIPKGSNVPWDDNKTVIDNLFDLTQQRHFTEEGTKNIADILSKYNFSFDDYVLTIVGTGSEAGKVLSKLSQLKRSIKRTESAGQKKERDARDKLDGALENAWKRLENIRRGGLVTQIATAARNLESVFIRSPFEALSSIMNTALYKLQHKEFRGMLDPSVWRGSLRPMEHILGDPVAARDWVRFILEQKELEPVHKQLFTNLNEIQELTGRGKATTLKGKAVDKTLSVAEDIVSVMNFANRWQENLVREGHFLGQLENLTKLEWDIDLLPALQEGKLRDLLSNSLRPEGKRSFEELMEDSARLALDVTYAKQPDTAAGKAIANFFTHTGVGPVRATWVAEFPRFMMNALELIGQGMAGSSIPLYKKLSSVLHGGKAHQALLFPKKHIPAMPIKSIQLTTKDRQRISRNVAGLAAFAAAYKAISSPDSPADVKMVRAPFKYKGEKLVVDTTAQFPLFQAGMIAKLTQQFERGTMMEFLSEAKNIKDIKNAFFGVSLRVGAGATLMDDVIDIIYNAIGETDLSDLVATEKAAKSVGRAIGNWGVSWLNVFRQQRDFERWIKVRGPTYKDVSVPPDLSKPFYKQVGEQAVHPLRASGFGLTPEEEAKLPPRIGIGRRTKDRILPGWKLIGGITFSKRDSRDIEYLERLNLSEWTIGSRSKDNEIRNFENGMINDIFPKVTEAIRHREAKYREQYRNSAPLLKKEQTMRQFVQPRTRKFALDYLGKHKEAIAEVAIGGKEKAGLTYFQASTRFRKLNKDRRRLARSEFISRTGRYPVYADAKDLTRMVEYAKMIGIPEGSDSTTQ